MNRRTRRAELRARSRAFNRAVHDGSLELGPGPNMDVLEAEAEHLADTESYRRGLVRIFKGVTRA